MAKPSVSPSMVEALLRQWRRAVSDLHSLTEGLASQAFGFRQGTDEYVIRINRSLDGFEKDAFASRTFARPALPIPQILDVGRLDEDHAFCISRRAPGVRLHDLDAACLSQMVPAIAQILAAIAASDLAGTTGFGRFDACGVAPYVSWRAYLTGVADPHRFDWEAAGRRTDRRMVDAAIRQIEELAAHCPEERCLVHGDFGSFNVLTDGARITAVIDWDLALFGDPLYDIANLLFWHEERLEPLIRYFESRWSGLPQWRERMLCYALRSGLQEIYESATGQGPCDVAWLTTRCKDILQRGTAVS